MPYARRALVALLLSILPAACCVTPPTAEEIFDLSFRSPELTFRTFQAGWRGELPRLEYRCFSQGFKGQNHLSLLAYLEFREKELASNLWFRKGVADAKILTSESLGEGRHLLRVGSHGHEFVVELVREEFWQLWSNETLLADELLAPGDFPQSTDVLDGLDTGPPLLVASAELTPDLAGLPREDLRAEMTEFRIGYEWKIDRIEQPQP